MGHSRQLIEKVFLIVYLILYSGGPLPVILSGGFSQGDDKPVTPPDFALIRLIFLLSYVIVLFLLLNRWKSVLFYLSKNRLILLLLAFTVCSILWSAQPNVTQSRAISLVGTTLFGIYLGTRFNLKEQLKILSVVFSIILVLSLVFAIALPKYGIMSGTHSGDWRGIYTHKNVFGQVMTLSSAFFLCMQLDKGRKNWVSKSGFILSFLMILMSTSTSALLNAVNLAVIILTLQVLRWRGSILIPVICCLAAISSIASMLVVSNLESVVGAFGKDLTLTGRADIWPIVVEVAWKRSFLGYGYSGFWGNWNSPGATVWKAYGWMAPNSHNGFLDLWVQLGFVGLFIFLIIFLKTLFRGLLLSKRAEASVYSWSVIYLIFTILSNLTETSLMINNSLNWILFVSISVSLSSFKLSRQAI